MNPCPCGHLGRSEGALPVHARAHRAIPKPDLRSAARSHRPARRRAAVAARGAAGFKRSGGLRGNSGAGTRCARAAAAAPGLPELAPGRAGTGNSLRIRREVHTLDAACEQAPLAFRTRLPSCASCGSHNCRPGGCIFDLAAASRRSYRFAATRPPPRWALRRFDTDPVIFSRRLVCCAGVSMTPVKPALRGPQPGKVDHEQGRRDALGRVASPEGRTLAGAHVDAGPRCTTPRTSRAVRASRRRGSHRGTVWLWLSCCCVLPARHRARAVRPAVSAFRRLARRNTRSRSSLHQASTVWCQSSRLHTAIGTTAHSLVLAGACRASPRFIAARRRGRRTA